MIITSKYKDPRPAPLNEHQGIDVIYSDGIVKFPKGFKRGRCIYVGIEKSGFGNYIVFRCVNDSNHIRFLSMAHFKTIFCKVDDMLGPGDKIGAQGDTGNATGVHCHIEISEAVDPEKFVI